MDMSAQKNLLRRKFRKLRSNLDPEYRTRADLKIISEFTKVLKRFDNPLVLAAYWPIHDELNIVPLLKELHESGVHCALPKLLDNSMEFVTWAPGMKLEPNKYDILEPESSKIVTPNLMIIPCITCDRSGNRLGYGKGYYDRYLTKTKIYTVALCYEKLISRTTLPYTVHDQKIDLIITELKDHNIS